MEATLFLAVVAVVVLVGALAEMSRGESADHIETTDTLGVR